MIALLLRLYPARWRARYGDEFAAVLGERPLGPFDVADVLLGALDAHLHLRGLGAASQHAKGFAMSLRIGGYAAILGGILWFVALAGNAINDGAESGALVLGWVLVAATILTLVALVGLSAFQARRHPVLVWAAFAIPTVGGDHRLARCRRDGRDRGQRRPARWWHGRMDDLHLRAAHAARRIRAVRDRHLAHAGAVPWRRSPTRVRLDRGRPGPRTGSSAVSCRRSSHCRSSPSRSSRSPSGGCRWASAPSASVRPSITLEGASL